MPSPPGCNGSAIATYDGIIPQTLTKFPSHDLWFHRLVAPRRAFFHDLPPVFHRGLRGLKETSVLFAFQQWNQLAQSVAAVADQPDLHRVSQSYAFRVELDLNAPSLVRLRHELDVRKR